jgi:alcohol dehydrogenase class IV
MSEINHRHSDRRKMWSPSTAQSSAARAQFLLSGRCWQEKTTLLVTDGNIARLDAAKQIQAILEENNRSVTLIDNVPPEPSHHDVSQVLNTLDTSGFDLVVGIGGGSVLDVAKLLSVLCHPQSPGLDALLAGKTATRLPHY